MRWNTFPDGAELLPSSAQQPIIRRRPGLAIHVEAMEHARKHPRRAGQGCRWRSRMRNPPVDPYSRWTSSRNLGRLRWKGDNVELSYRSATSLKFQAPPFL